MTTREAAVEDGLTKAFGLALQELSTVRLRKLAQHFAKNLEGCSSRDQFVHLLTTKLNREQKLAAMRESVLAGRTAMAIIKLPADHPGVQPQEDTDFTEATATPRVVAVGKLGEVMQAQQHIAWAMLAGHNTYVDSYLNLQVDDQATVIESFYEPALGLLQVRSSAYVAQKIAKEWAKMAGLQSAEVELVGLKDRAEFHAFAALLKASVVRCTGELHESRGFDVVSARKHANFPDLVGTPDYDDFQKETAAIDGDIEFSFDARKVKLGIGIATRSLVFRTYAKEATIQYVYGKLKEYLKLNKVA